MYVYEFDNKIECNSLEDLQEVLRHRSKNNSNEFEIRTDLGYPFLTILVKDEFACVHYFKDESDCGHYAYIDNHELEQEYIDFNMGSDDSVTEISKDLVISVEQAYIAAIDFYNTRKMSTKMKWFEL